MDSPIRIFIGTDPQQRDARAELVLEHSIRRNSSRDDIEIVWMRAGDPGFEISRDGADGTWRVGDAVDGAWTRTPGSWGTPFSCFRFAIPELCRYEGRAIYLDADMLVPGDIAELWNMDIAPGRAIRCAYPSRTDVMLISASRFRDRPDWPSVAEMRSSGAAVVSYIAYLILNGAVDPTLPDAWNDLDGIGYAQNPGSTRIVHYTTAPSQPWRPYSNIEYADEWPYCPACTEAGKLWWRYLQEALLQQDPATARAKLQAMGGHWQDN